VKEFAHTCSDGHHEIGFNDPDDEFSERCPLCKEIDRLVDGIRDHLISLGAPADRIDGAGCDSGDPLDFTTAEITQAFGYFEDQRPAPRSRSKKQKIEDKLRQSDLTARLTGRDDIEYGHHETLPRGEHVANRKG
jgi:hypothetical protein